MIKYNTALCVRINDNLKNTISEICNDTRINEADWVRSSLADCAKKDAADLEQVRERFMLRDVKRVMGTNQRTVDLKKKVLEK